MIYDSLAHIQAYEGIHPGVYKALKLLAETDFSQMADQRYEVDGDDLFFFLQSYETKPENPTPESHKKYIDIQCVLSGMEAMDVGALEDMTGIAEARPEGDIWLHKGSGVRLPLGGGRFLALFPGDGHAPSIGPNGPAPARKCVVKVRV